MASKSDYPTAPPEQRVAALQIVLRRNGELPESFVPDFTDHAEEDWITDNGARMVARAWVDPAFRARMLADGKAAAQEMGFEFPEHHRHLVVLENTPNIHNVIVCTLCSCTAYTIIGAAPDWYKDIDYREGSATSATGPVGDIPLPLECALGCRPERTRWRTRRRKSHHLKWAATSKVRGSPR